MWMIIFDMIITSYLKADVSPFWKAYLSMQSILIFPCFLLWKSQLMFSEGLVMDWWFPWCRQPIMCFHDAVSLSHCSDSAVDLDYIHSLNTHTPNHLTCHRPGIWCLLSHHILVTQIYLLISYPVQSELWVRWAGFYCCLWILITVNLLAAVQPLYTL